MTMDNLLDTLQNIIVFVPIGIIIWLFFKKEPDHHSAEDASQKKNENKDISQR